MQIVQFICDNPATALRRIHRQLGPDAVVVSVRRLPPQGAARLWPGCARVEVLAGVPELPPEPGHDLQRCAESRVFAAADTPGNGAPSRDGTQFQPWQSIDWLQAMGLSPANGRRLRSSLQTSNREPPATLEAEWDAVRAALAAFWAPDPGADAEPGAGAHVFIGPPDSIEEEWELVRAALVERWLSPAGNDNDTPSRPHVFVGPPGSGKTTVLCKWLTLAVLTGDRAARVWRLDNHLANTAEFLSVHCEMLGTPVERLFHGSPGATERLFFDLPGIEMDDLQAMDTLRSQLSGLPPHRLHLVLNAAYETESLLAQWRAFSDLKPGDLILTHLDEEKRRVKLWNLVFGTNCRIRFLSAGQKIPGDFQSASPDLLFPSEFRP
jgi:flagellar biosynthesis GTPase FlhF